MPATCSTLFFLLGWLFNIHRCVFQPMINFMIQNSPMPCRLLWAQCLAHTFDKCLLNEMPRFFSITIACKIKNFNCHKIWVMPLFIKCFPCCICRNLCRNFFPFYDLRVGDKLLESPFCGSQGKQTNCSSSVILMKYKIKSKIWVCFYLFEQTVDDLNLELSLLD